LAGCLAYYFDLIAYLGLFVMLILLDFNGFLPYYLRFAVPEPIPVLTTFSFEETLR
jgi:hypothetical protein